MEETLVNEPIVDEILDEPVESEVVEEVKENTDETIESDEFNPDELFDEEDGKEEISYNIAGYDLSKYKDVLDFENEENVKEFAEHMQKYYDKGFTQEQVEFLLEDKLSDYEEKEPKKPTQKEIKERLQNSLTKEEIRNYKATTNMIRDFVSGTEFEGKLKDIVQNPTLVKLFHNVYKKSLGKTTNLGSVTKRQEKQIASMSYDEARGELMKVITQKGDKVKTAKSLYNQVSDKNTFSQLLNTVGIKI